MRARRRLIARSPGSDGPSPARSDALHADQHADPTGVYPCVSVSDSCRGPERSKRRTRAGESGIYLSGCVKHVARRL